MGEETTIVERLKRDHRRLEELFGQLDERSNEELVDYFRTLREELIRHEVAKEQIVYPAFRKHVPGADLIADSCIEEEEKTELALADLEGEDSAGDSFRLQLEALRSSVLEQAQREERDMLPALAMDVDEEELVSLGDRYDRATRAAPTHPHPHAPHTPPGNTLVDPVAALIDRLRDAMRAI